MNKVCIGCGSKFQTLDKNKEGYINPKVYEKATLCERCFKIKYYGEAYVTDNPKDKTSLIKMINDSKKSVVYLVDTLTISKETLSVIDSLSNKVYLVLTKRDLLPKSVKNSKLKEYISNLTLIKDVFVISALKNNGVTELYNELIKNNEKSVYVIGYTSSGKSTFINKLLTLNGKSGNITTSSLPNTTLECINIKLNDKLTLIDTPGFVSENSSYNFIDVDIYKKLLPKSVIKPKVYTIKKEFMIILGDILRIENNSNEDVNLVFYFKNEIKLNKMRSIRNKLLKDKDKLDVKVSDKDIILEGLGYIKVVGYANLTMYTLNKKMISVRNKMI
jgi:ribosome biogenesis GTPase A